MAESDIVDVQDRPRQFGDVIIHGGRVHLGDVYHPELGNQEQKQVEKLLDSLRFPEMNARKNQVVESHHSTFGWLFGEGNGRDSQSEEDTAYQSMRSRFADWLVDDEPVFWIGGKPGSGKSTLMKYLSSHELTSELLSTRTTSGSVLILTFYFWLRGSEDQRSLKACLCSLLYQLLDADHGLAKRVVHASTALKKKVSYTDWSHSEAKALLLNALAAQNVPSILVFIDGLDEFDKSSNLRDLLDFLQSVSQTPGVKLCVSSREEPVLQQRFASRPHIRLQDVTYTDLLAVAQSRLEVELMEAAESTLSIDSIPALAKRIADDAEGVFIWALLAIKSIVLGIRNDDDEKTLLRRLEGLPHELMEMFERMWLQLQHDDHIYRNETILYFSIISNTAFEGSVPILLFTLLTNEELLARFLSLKSPPSERLLDDLIRATTSLRRRLSARTAGLLEIKKLPLDHKFWTQPRDDERYSDLAVCTCRPLAAIEQCFAKIGQAEKLEQLHWSNITYVHRSAAEFIMARLSTQDQGQSKSAPLIESMVRASFVLYGLGCHCMDAKYLSGALVTSSASQYDTEQLFSEGSTMLSTWGCWNCHYGQFHKLFFRRGPEWYFTPHGERLIYLDLPGLLSVWLPGLPERSGPKLADIGLGTPYYKGYLLACMARGASSGIPDPMSKIITLIMQGADISTPQPYRFFLFGFDDCFLVIRSPIFDCWLNTLQLILNSQLESYELVPEVRVLASKLAAQSYPGQEETLCRIGFGLISRRCVDIRFCNDDVINCFQETFGMGNRTLVVYLNVSVMMLKTLTERAIGRATKSDCNLPEASLPSMRPSGCLIEITHGTSFFVDANESEQILKNVWNALSCALCQPQRVELERNVRELTASICDFMHRPVVWPSDTSFRSLESVMITKGYAFGLNPQQMVPVPPDAKREIQGKEWYEHGMLRDWHARRRNGIVKASRGVQRFEETHGLVPGYETYSHLDESIIRTPTWRALGLTSSTRRTRHTIGQISKAQCSSDKSRDVGVD